MSNNLQILQEHWAKCNEQIDKWSDVLNHKAFAPITNKHKAFVTATVLENTHNFLKTAPAATSHGVLKENSIAAGAIGANGLSGSGTATQTGGLAGFDPILIPMIRRAAPNLLAYDVASVQPLSAPSGLIFAMKSHYINGPDTAAGRDVEALYHEADTTFSASTKATKRGYEIKKDDSGANTHPLGSYSSSSSNPGLLNTSGGSDNYERGSTGLARNEAEIMGTSGKLFNEMKFTIEKTAVTAKTRGLAADFTIELQQDLRAIHGLDAENELMNMLSSEIIAEINREIIRTIYYVAQTGADRTQTPGTFSLNDDGNGRWLVEQFKTLHFHMELDANAIARKTRRGKGNVMICSDDVASALASCKALDYASAMTPPNNSEAPGFEDVDATGNLYVGTINGRTKVYVDPYGANDSASQYYVLGYKGPHPWDAGLFYCPYIPLEFLRATRPDEFQPRIGFKTRYGIVANPYVVDSSGNPDAEALTFNRNQYYRRTNIDTLL